MCLLIGAHAENDARVALFGDEIFQSHCLERRAAFDASHRVVHALGESFLVLADDEIQPPLAGEPVAVFDHRRNLVARVHVQERERHVAEESLAREPQQHGRILAHGPEHAEVVEVLVGFAKDVHTLVFELSKVFHVTGTPVANSDSFFPAAPDSSVCCASLAPACTVTLLPAT